MRYVSNAPKACIVALLISLAAPGLSSQSRSVAALLPAEVVSQLAATGRAVHTGTVLPAFLPIHPSSSSLQYALAAEKPSILVEAVFSIPRPEPADAAARS